MGQAASQNAFATTVDATGNIYVAGEVLTPAGNFDIFVAKLSSDGTKAFFNNQIGGDGHDEADAIVVDQAGNIYLAGYTNSRNFPVSGTSQNLHDALDDAFFMKLSPQGSILYSNYLGGCDNDYSEGLALDLSGNLWVAGRTRSTDFFTTPHAVQTTPKGKENAFLTQVDPTGKAVYSTYSGGSALTRAFGVAGDRMAVLISLAVRPRPIYQ